MGERRLPWRWQSRSSTERSINRAMDPLQWQQVADEYAARMNQVISALESEFWPHTVSGSFRTFWPRVRELNEQVRTAPAIRLEDKLALQRRLNELCQRARRDQKALQRQNAMQKQELLAAVTFARESIAEAATAEEAQQVRAELSALRQRIGELDASFRREDRQEIWNAWQGANQAAWERVNALWAANEAFLASLLDESQRRLEAGDPRAAKEQVKFFHEGARLRECSHRALRTLRGRAHSLWAEADDVARRKHEAYLTNVGKRLTHWRAVRERHTRARADMAQQIAELEQRAASAPTDVGAALVRGQLAERRRALAAIDAADRDLQKQIDAAESTLSHA